MVKNKLRRLAYEFELDTQVIAKCTQVGGQTKGKLNASRKLALACESVWSGLKELDITERVLLLLLLLLFCCCCCCCCCCLQFEGLAQLTE